jgi:hypothetical protein
MLKVADEATKSFCRRSVIKCVNIHEYGFLRLIGTD